MHALLRTLALALAALLLVGAGSAVAATYTVTRTDDPNPAPCEPADCSLRGALTAANATTSVDDVVVLPASAAPYLLQYEFLTFTIKDEVEVRGAGASQTVVKGDGQETIFYVEPGVKATLTGLTITGGTSAIQNNGEATVRGVSIEGNKWNGGTAGIITNGPFTVEGSFLGFNRTEAASGGAIHTNAPLTIINSTIAQNFSKDGPGAISTNAAVSIVNSALVSNRSETASPAAVGGVPLTVRNSIFADNRNATGLLNCASAGPLTSFGGNVSDDGSCGTTATDKPNVNPLLGSLDLHGGTTRVYDLLAGSPAIDAAQQCPAVDQRGVTRPQGAACDSGPYEYVPPVTPPPPGDSALRMRLGKGKLFVDGKGRTKVRLTCPSSEASPPCSGKVKLTGRFSSSAKFKIGAGKTKAVVLRLPKGALSFLEENPEKRKAGVLVRARDGAGNRQTIKQKRKLVPR